MNVEERKLEVLRAIITDFIATNEPVGSKTLADRHNLGVSPATIRNDMAALEDEGLIQQPHTSAGRVPTDAGYRMFVDKLTSVKPLSQAERRAIERFLNEAVDLDGVLQNAVRALAQLTRNVAVVQYPSLSRSRVRHMETVLLSPVRLMLVLITDTGRVEQRVVELPGPVENDDVADLRNSLNAKLKDQRLADAPAIIAELPTAVAGHLQGLVTTLSSVLLEALVEHPSERVVLAGSANLTEHVLDFPAIRPVLEALEEQVVLLRLLDQQTTTSGQILVRIGNENLHEGLQTASVVSAGYGRAGISLGGVGVLGPRRMDYAQTMARVAAVASYVGELLAEN
jgi:heat-inducible transcriptional repressor